MIRITNSPLLIKTPQRLKPLGKRIVSLASRISLPQTNRIFTSKEQDLLKNILQVNSKYSITIPSNSTAQLNQVINVLEKVHNHHAPTVAHMKRVGLFSLLLSRAHNHRGEQQWQSFIGGTIHDIGKLFTPVEILNSNSKLNNNEYKKVQEHVNGGIALLDNYKLLWEHENAIAHHHERPDGNGYPNFLKQKEISISGKVISITDAFDAMLDRTRVYQGVNNMDFATIELASNINTQFDLKLTQAFIQIIKTQSELIDNILSI